MMDKSKEEEKFELCMKSYLLGKDDARRQDQQSKNKQNAEEEIESVEGATKYLESQGIDVEACVKKGMEFIRGIEKENFEVDIKEIEKYKEQPKNEQGAEEFPEIENLKAKMRGFELNIYQEADALIEFNKLVEYASSKLPSEGYSMEFLKWYSGMEEKKILNAHKRWMKEQLKK